MMIHQLFSLSSAALFLTGLLDLEVSRVYADEMTATEAYTLWFVIFNQPTNCVGSPCGIIDVMGQDFLDSIEAGAPNPALIAPNAEADIGVIYAGGTNSGDNGQVRMTAGLYRTIDPIATDGMADPLGLQQGWTNPDAEVHLVLRSHGSTNMEGGNVDQIANILDPYCDDPLLLHEGDKANGNICSDKQDVIVMAGESGELPVHVFGTGEPVEGARAIVNRRGEDLIQFILETHTNEETPMLLQEPKAAASKTSGGEGMDKTPSTVTVWWVIFNNPSTCTTAPGEDIACGRADLAVPAAEPAAIWAAGNVADDKGKLHLTSSLYLTKDPLILDEEIDFKGLGRGFISQDAEVHLVVRDHGPVVWENDGYLTQIANFNDEYEGCCSNVQAAPFAPGEDGEKTLYVMSDRTEIEGTKAVLNRRGDLLQAIIETVDPAMMTEMDKETEMISGNEDMASGASTVGTISCGLIFIIAVVVAMI